MKHDSSSLTLTRAWVGRFLRANLIGALALGLVQAALAQPAVITSDTLLSGSDLQFEGQDVVVDGARLTVGGAHSFNSLRIRNNGVVTHPAFGGEESTVDLTIAGNLAIEAGSRIDASQRGYPASSGPGAGADGYLFGAGAGHGGVGGDNYYGGTGSSYGSLVAPRTAGSGGGYATAWGKPGGTGGGVIRLQVGGELVLDGAIQADAGDGIPNAQGGGGGGSGGSIWISAGTVSGAGSISADGGSAFGWEGRTGGGAGGRIAIEYNTMSHTGSIQALGGNGYVPGGAGTVYLKNRSKPTGDLVVANGGRAGQRTPWEFTSDMGRILVDARASLQVTGTASWTTESLTVTNGGGLVISGGSRVDVRGMASVGTGSVVTFLSRDNASQVDGAWVGTGATLSAQDLTLQVGGGITANGLGYESQTGPGAGGAGYLYGAGGGHGGYGGNNYYGSVAGTYGSLTEPVALGSGGGVATAWGKSGGAGGGAVRLIVPGRLVLDGTVSADGIDGVPNAQGGGGGGSGGSVFLTVGSLSGNGTISASGGGASGWDGRAGGGSGGRIAVHYNVNEFAGTLTARGGGGYVYGGAGTVFLKDTAKPIGDLLVNNGGNRGQRTPWASATAFDRLAVAGSAIPYFMGGGRWTVEQASISDGATLALSGGTTLAIQGPLKVGTNASILCECRDLAAVEGRWVGVGVVIQAWLAQVEAGGAITADGQGYGAGQGPGAGGSGYVYGAGAGYGAPGAASGNAGGGVAYGSLYEALAPGSGGGYANAWGAPGGAGGGVIAFSVTGELRLDGQISANGASGSVVSQGGGGGGSGGSVNLSVGTLSGTGVITANGGNAGGWDVRTGAGAGGRVAIYYGQDLFTGIVGAAGGSAGYPGGAGTVYRKDNAARTGDLEIGNLDRSGTWTPWTLGADFRKLTVGRGGVLHLAGTRNWMAQEVVLSDESTLVIGGGLTLTVDSRLTVGNKARLVGQAVEGVGVTINAGSVFIEEGGAITADGQGYPSGQGPGAGGAGYTYGAGAGHAAAGGNSTQAGGGGTYGSVFEPMSTGSAGGQANAWGAPGGAGGGALRLIVAGECSILGDLSADGANGAVVSQGGGGGGAGGACM